MVPNDNNFNRELHTSQIKPSKKTLYDKWCMRSLLHVHHEACITPITDYIIKKIDKNSSKLFINYNKWNIMLKING